MNIKTIFGGLIALSFSVLAITQAQTASNFELRLNLRAGQDALELGKTYKTPGGLEYQVDLVKFYISNVNLVRPDGALLALPGIALSEFRGMGAAAGQTTSNTNSNTTAGQLMPNGQMFKANATQNTVVFAANVPNGEYRGLRFDVGVPKDLNNRDASLQQLPLGVEAGMFWAWNPGYIFYRFEGKTMVAGKWQPFLLHMGTDAYRMPVNAFDLQTNKIKIVVGDTGARVTMNLDVTKAFDKDPSGAAGWDLSKPEKRVMHGGPSIGQAYLNLLGAWTLGQN